MTAHPERVTGVVWSQALGLSFLSASDVQPVLMCREDREPSHLRNGDLCQGFSGQEQLDKEDILGEMSMLIALLILLWRRPPPLFLCRYSRVGIVSCCLVVFCWPVIIRKKMSKCINLTSDV